MKLLNSEIIFKKIVLNDETTPSVISINSATILTRIEIVK